MATATNKEVFPFENGLKVQEDDLKFWKTVLNDRAYQLLKQECEKQNKIASSRLGADGYSVFRGNDISTFIQNIKETAPTEIKWSSRKSKNSQRTEIWADGDVSPLFEIIHNETTIREAEKNIKLIENAPLLPSLLEWTKKLQGIVEQLILSTPSSEVRNKICEFNIKLLTAINNASK